MAFIVECSSCGQMAETQTRIYAENLVTIHRLANPEHHVAHKEIV